MDSDGGTKIGRGDRSSKNGLSYSVGSFEAGGEFSRKSL